MTKTIAYLTTQLDGWYQSQIWQGGVVAAHSRGTRLLCLVGGSDARKVPDPGKGSIYELAHHSQVDGILLAAGPLAYWHGLGVLRRFTEAFPSGKPLVLLGMSQEGQDCVVPEGSGVRELVRHLIERHGCRRLVFLGGPVHNPDAHRRLEDYRAALSDAGLPYVAELVEDGGFHLDSGTAAMARILARRVSFDAVVAANDSMALGAFRALQQHGFRVPRDIALVGFDDSREGRFMQPPLTTVVNPTDAIAERGMTLCLERIADPSIPFRLLQVEGPVRIRKSCGCLEAPSDVAMLAEEGQVVEMLVAQLLADSAATRDQFLFWLRDQLSSGAASAAQDCERLVHLVGLELRRRGASERVDKAIGVFGMAQEILFEARQGELNADLLRQGVLVRDLHHLESAVLAHVEPDQIVGAFAAHVVEWCPAGVRVFMFHSDLSPEEECSYLEHPYAYKRLLQAGQVLILGADEPLLPEPAEPGDIWTAVPVEHGGLRFGLLLFHNWTRDESYMENLRIIFSAALAISWRTRSEAFLREKLRHLSLRDELTGLYNRRGLMEVSAPLISRAVRERRRLAVILMDLDGLKIINDRFGHADGDRAIALFGQALRESFRTSDVVARFGGDEFAGVAMVEGRDELDVLLQRLHRLVRDTDADQRKDWKLSFSMGWSLWTPGGCDTMEMHMEEADRMLYREKAQKKSAR